jgi:hypothetical protein
MEVDVYSLRQAGKELGCYQDTIKGVVWGLGIQLKWNAGAWLMSQADFQRVKAQVDKMRPGGPPPIKRRRKRCTV